MRSYPRNSPQAAARIVALSLLADGHLGSSELAALHRLAEAGRFGTEPPDVPCVVRDAVLDLLATGGPTWSGAAHLDAHVLAGVLHEIDDPALRRDVLALCHTATRADRHVSEGEKAFLAALAAHWQLPAASLA
jgi:hypothetical protein